MAGQLSMSSGTTKSDTEAEAGDSSKGRSGGDDVMSETAPPPSTEDPVGEEEDKDEALEDDASEMLQMFHSQQDTQAWRWEQQWVLCGTPSAIAEMGKDGTKILVGGFMEYYCPHPGCGKVFPAVGSLRKHMHIHGEKQFICEHCGKRFLDNSKLKRHTAIHFRESADTH